MIEQYAPAPRRGLETRLVLRPDRALTARQLFLLFAVLAFAMGMVAAIAYTQGNAFAPAFALLDSGLVGLALYWVWRSGQRFEVIAVDGSRVVVARSRESEPAFTGHPYWVRVAVDQDRGRLRVRLACSGRRIEVGSFLREPERLNLAERLKGLLAAAASGGGRQL